jgi:amidase
LSDNLGRLRNLWILLPMNEPQCPEYSFPLAEPAYNAKRPRDLSPFATAIAQLTEARRRELDGWLLESSLPAIGALLDRGALTSVELATYYAERIARYDVGRLNAVMELNPAALHIAAGLDLERIAAGGRGPLHGIPVLIKDNIATGDGMRTTAGAYALRDWRPADDAFLVARLREAGAIILGKTNLSEWANWMDPSMPNGFSTLGGQTRHPSGPFDASGSSSGSAVAVAANLVPVSVGSETQGSITWPARDHSLVGLKTSLGLISRSGVVPLVDWMDVPGPFGRSVRDVAILLSILAAPGPAGVDPADPATAAAAPLVGRDFTQYLTPEMARRVRVGVVQGDVAAALTAREQELGRPLTDKEARKIRDRVPSAAEAEVIVTALRAEGVPAVLIPFEAARLTEPPPFKPMVYYAFRESFSRFMAGLGDAAPVASLADVVAINAADPANRAPYGYRSVADSAATTMTAEAYAAAVEANRTGARDGLRTLFRQYGVDVVCGHIEQSFAAAGFPALVVPNGLNTQGHPVGLQFVGDYLSEPQLLAVGAAFERARPGRVAPDLEAVLAMPPV